MPLLRNGTEALVLLRFLLNVDKEMSCKSLQKVDHSQDGHQMRMLSLLHSNEIQDWNAVLHDSILLMNLGND